MTRTAGARIGCQRPSRFWGLGCPKIYHEVEDTLDYFFSAHQQPGGAGVSLCGNRRQRQLSAAGL
ncbi:hypothetical protein [Thiolapillus sp.]|uniref:hypothetical protein n=1 Tax=Thiolapillus sp. TaxID=2017437 RepID=UPI003AF57E8F